MKRWKGDEVGEEDEDEGVDAGGTSEGVGGEG